MHAKAWRRASSLRRGPSMLRFRAGGRDADRAGLRRRAAAGGTKTVDGGSHARGRAGALGLRKLPFSAIDTHHPATRVNDPAA